MVIGTALRWVVALAGVAAVMAGASSAVFAKAEGDVNFFLGIKTLDEDDWEPIEDQGAFGAEISIGQDTWPVMIAIDPFFSGAKDDEFGFDLKGATSELAIGVRKIWNVDNVHPYVGGGPSLLSASLEVENPFGADVDDDDTTLGWWLGGGVFWRLGSRFNIGIAARFSSGEVTLFDVDLEAGGLQGGLLLGWGWPATP
jgi:hypothetical protein